MLPSLFVSHGAPTLPFNDVPARDFLRELGPSLERPRAILMVSAHWETDVPTLNAVAVNETIHDFGGFPRELYEIQYPAPGSAELAGRVEDLLRGAGMEVRIDRTRGLDHGAWVPLMLAYPDADIPVVQLSIQSEQGPAYHVALGRALAPLRAEGVLVIASGSFTHNLGEFRNHGRSGIEPAWVSEFAAWFNQALAENRIADLVDYRRLAPHAAQNHPTDEHLLPLYVALGAGGADPKIAHLHSSQTFGILRMDSYAFQ